MNLVETYTQVKASTTPSAVPYATKNSEEKKYKDPLLKWPAKGLAYSNEIGAAISPLSPKLGTALWAPALLYFGADIYDKYKNDQTSYDPSTKRALKQTIFQSLASVILPTAAVHVGQKAISYLDKYTQKGLTTQAKEDAIEFCHNHMSKNSLHTFENNISTYKKNLHESLETYMSETLGEYKSKGIISKIFNFCFSSKHPESMALSNTEKLNSFIDDHVDSMFKMRKELMQGKQPKELSAKLFKKFNDLQPGYLKEFGKEKYLGKAAKSILKDHNVAEIFKNKTFKTIGGFISLGLMIKPIDLFVEHVIIKKAVEPHLEKISFQ